MKTLFLAMFTLTQNEYMGDSTTSRIMTLVWANDADEAETIVMGEYDRDDAYSLYQSVSSLKLVPALGEP